MNTVHRYLDVICKDASGEEVKIYSEDYEEFLDEIKVRTKMRHDKLDRGWIGDLTYATVKAYEVESGTETEAVATSTYNDVLLANVTVYDTDDGMIIWEYRFLKK